MRSASTPALAFALLFSMGCGSDSNGPGTGCPDGWTLANPDGRGQRCVRADSDCFSPIACGGGVTACCQKQCADPDGDFLYTCEETCQEPDCTSADQCAPGERCETYSECSAACVPDEACPAGQLMANPDGLGFRCIPAASSCFRPADCGPSADPCCETRCEEAPSGLFECAESCEGDIASGAEDAAPEPLYECRHDSDCVDLYGEGWTCSGCPGYCVEPLGICHADTDCVIAIRENCCCPCPTAWSRAEVAADACTVPWGEEMPAECVCKFGCDMECVECNVPIGVQCVENDCVPTWE